MNAQARLCRHFVTSFLFAMIAIGALVLPARHSGAMDPLTSARSLDARVAALEAQVQTLVMQVQKLQNRNETQQAQIHALKTQSQEFKATLACMSKDGDDVFFTGCNVNIRNGLNITATKNGLGNIIIGYNEINQPDFPSNDRSGSHNLVVGSEHTYSSYAGLVAGFHNTISGVSASVSGGAGNTANGEFAAVSGGNLNMASGPHASVSGGIQNTASGSRSSVSGGDTNKASSTSSSVSGGASNNAIGLYSSISGGDTNVTTERAASISGGAGLAAGNTNCWRAGTAGTYNDGC